MMLLTSSLTMTFRKVCACNTNCCNAFVVPACSGNYKGLTEDIGCSYTVVTNRTECCQGLEQDITSRILAGCVDTVSARVGVSDLIFGGFMLIDFLALVLISWPWSSNNCSTLIVHLHRSCPDCSYEQCLSCCHELRRGMFPGNSCKAVYKYSDRGCDYMHGGEPLPESFHNMKIPQDQNKPISWVANCDGYIICAPVEMGGCEKCVLELKHLLTRNWISTLNAKAERILIQCNFS
ncbi:hypothetical protein FXO38_18592 [Capsicum annuum]|nr:hypothetical protein FXO38_18592 [Capsicum annuum]KAF3656039.1 hypothetical protein FXO37_15632 [Capsicum annuum]